MRRGLIVLLSLGVVVGFGSGFARIAHRGGCHGGGQWSRYDGERGDYRGDREFDRFDRSERTAAPAPVQQQQAAPVYIVMPSAPAAAPIIVNGAQGQAAPANVVVIPAQPAQVAPPAANPQAAPVAR